MNKPLLPCPFCGGEARIKSRYIGYGSVGLGARDWYTVECNECRAKSDEYGAELEAIAAWNRRTDHIRDSTKMVTNADRIRKTADEELAKMIAYNDVFYEEICGSDERTRVCDNDCVACTLEWLRQRAKEE